MALTGCGGTDPAAEPSPAAAASPSQEATSGSPAATSAGATEPGAVPSIANRPAEPPSPAGDTRVAISGLAYRPATLTVPVGTTVTWTNADTSEHTVTAGTPSDQAGTFDLTVASGATVTQPFEQAGTFPYYCRIHPFMLAEVVVQ